MIAAIVGGVSFVIGFVVAFVIVKFRQAGVGDGSVFGGKK